MTITINGTTGITNDGGYTGDGVVFADTTPANTLVTTTGGNVGIGTSSPAQKLNVSGSGSIYGLITNTGTGPSNLYLGAANAQTQIISRDASTGAVPTVFIQGTTESARIDSSGNLLVGTTTSNGRITVYNNTAVAGSGIVTCYSDFGSTNNIRVVIRADGGIANYQANNTNLSDERTKKNIEISGGYLDKICSIPVKLFNYKDEAEGSQRTLGVIAQDVEAVAPELVDASGFGETPDDGVPLKAIYQTDLQYALMKCIQEQQAIITALTARVAALEGK